MAFIPVPLCVEIVLRFIWAGQIVAITLTFCRDDDVTPELMTDLIENLEDWFDDKLSGDLSNDILLVAVTCRDLTASDSFVIESSDSIAGAISDDSVPNNSTLVVTFETGLAGRSFRGRNYIPGLPKGALDSSVAVNPTVVSNFLSDYSFIPDYVEDDGWTHCVVSRYHDNAPRVTGVATPIVGYSSDGFLDSQRRRLAGRGD